MSWVLALPMCQEILMVIEILAYKINKFKTGHPVLWMLYIEQTQTSFVEHQTGSNM